MLLRLRRHFGADVPEPQSLHLFGRRQSDCFICHTFPILTPGPRWRHHPQENSITLQCLLNFRPACNVDTREILSRRRLRHGTRCEFGPEINQRPGTNPGSLNRHCPYQEHSTPQKHSHPNAVKTITVHLAMTIRLSLFARTAVEYKFEGNPGTGPSSFAVRVKFRPLT